MTKTIIQLDFANTNRAATVAGVTLDFKDLLDYLGENNNSIRESTTYLQINAEDPDTSDELIEYLGVSGWQVKTEMVAPEDLRSGTGVDCGLAVDAMHYRNNNGLDYLILFAGDSGYVPLVRYMRYCAGVFVAVAAFKDTCSPELMKVGNSFIDLAVYYEDYVQRGSAKAANKQTAAENEFTEAIIIE